MYLQNNKYSIYKISQPKTKNMGKNNEFNIKALQALKVVHYLEHE